MNTITPSKKSHIWLSSFEGLSNKNIDMLLQKFGSAVELVKKFKSCKNDIESVTGSPLYGIMLDSLNPGYLNPILQNLLDKNIDVITIDDGDYPENLKNIEDPPHILYALGDITLLYENLITVVGSRKCTRYGEEQAEKIVKGLCEYGFTVISGLAEGIDTAANKAALKYGKTIAVIAGGFDHIYPSSNERLYGEIAEKGLILSEFPPDTEIKPYMFPLRNRIMAALGEAAVIIEAGINSGALITANLALNYGKELFVLPGNVNSPSSAGCNKLIKEMQGAIITDYGDILESFGIETDEKESEDSGANVGLNGTEKQITEFLGRGDSHINEIMEYTKLSVKDANAVLSVMEIKGLIKKLPGNNFGI